MQKYIVASFAEAWIEIQISMIIQLQQKVASFAEAWIEIILAGIKRLWKTVASFAEAWIEMLTIKKVDSEELESPPSRRRGLKFTTLFALQINLVASFAEAWIEICCTSKPRF